jgi:ATP-dependent 26S proteasome regulatory subunit
MIVVMANVWWLRSFLQWPKGLLLYGPPGTGKVSMLSPPAAILRAVCVDTLSFPC